MYAHPLVHSHLAAESELALQRRLARPRAHSGAQTSIGATTELRPVVEAARNGDQAAWEALVARFTPSMQMLARSYRLGHADIEDAVQTAWTRAVAHIARIREPEAISGWLMVTTRREALRTLERRRRELLVDEPGLPERVNHTPAETPLIDAERRRAVRAAVERLPRRQRIVIGGLLDHSGSSYAELSARLEMPIGSIGPTRERALARLRRDGQLTATLER